MHLCVVFTWLDHFHLVQLEDGDCWKKRDCSHAPPGGLAPQPRNPAEPFPGACGAELAIVVTPPAWGAPGPPPGVTVAGKLVGVPVNAPCSVPGAPVGPPPPPCCRFPIRLQPAWFRAAATRAGFMGRAPMLRPAIPAIGLLADWPPPGNSGKVKSYCWGPKRAGIVGGCNHSMALRIFETVRTLLGQSDG